MKRVCPPGIQPLELWDLCVGQGILWDHMQSKNLGALLNAGLIQLKHSSARTRSEGQILTPAFNHLYLAGGGAQRVVDDLQAGPWLSVHLNPDCDFAGSAGGEFLLAQQGLTGWVLDLGQSTLKISSTDQRRTWTRDLTQLPIRQNQPGSPNEQRVKLRYFLAAALQEFRSQTSTPPEGIVCALPSRLDDTGMPEGSSYIGMGGDVTLLPDALALAGLKRTQILALNDAELAAISAQLDPRVQATTLVLTLGFGVGAALIIEP